MTNTYVQASEHTKCAMTIYFYLTAVSWLFDLVALIWILMSYGTHGKEDAELILTFLFFINHFCTCQWFVFVLVVRGSLPPAIANELKLITLSLHMEGTVAIINGTNRNMKSGVTAGKMWAKTVASKVPGVRFERQENFQSLELEQRNREQQLQ